MTEELNRRGSENVEANVWDLIIRKGTQLHANTSRTRIFEALELSHSLQEAAATLIPDSYATSPDVAAGIVRFAAAKYDETALQEILDRNTSRLRDNFTKISPGRTKQERADMDTEAGRHGWGNESEELDLLLLTEDPVFQQPANSRQKGHPDFEAIATALNAKYWRGFPYRSAKECKAKLARIRGKQRKESPSPSFIRPIEAWSFDEQKRLVTLCIDNLQTSGRGQGTPDLQTVTAAMPDRSLQQCKGMWQNIRDNPKLKQQLEDATGKKIPDAPKTINWSIVDARLIELAKSHRHPAGHQHQGKPQWLILQQYSRVSFQTNHLSPEKM